MSSKNRIGYRLLLNSINNIDLRLFNNRPWFEFTLYSAKIQLLYILKIVRSKVGTYGAKKWVFGKLLSWELSMANIFCAVAFELAFWYFGI